LFWEFYSQLHLSFWRCSPEYISEKTLQHSLKKSVSMVEHFTGFDRQRCGIRNQPIAATEYNSSWSSGWIWQRHMGQMATWRICAVCLVFGGSKGDHVVAWY
jgi:hypothetical protein